MTASDRDPDLSALLRKVAEARGVVCESYKESCLRRRLATRMRALGVRTFAEYSARLDTDEREYERFLTALTINVTGFYRNPETWEAVAARCLPELGTHRRHAPRCWSVGCATGEEAYTLAIVWLEHARRAQLGLEVPAHIDATDIDAPSLRTAERGVYPRKAVAELTPSLVGCYFTGGDEVQVLPEVRRLVRFRRHDITCDAAPRAEYDLIICRNVMIYFERAMQERLYHAFAEALTPGGFLVLGKVETIVGPARDRLQLEDPRERIYRGR